MNFEIYNTSQFNVGIDIFPRMYQALLLRSGLIRIRHIITGFILYDNLNINDIQVEGNPISNIDILQAVIYNSSCECSDVIPPGFIRIFDLTFDETFE